MATSADVRISFPARPRKSRFILLCMRGSGLEKRQFGHRARLALSPAEAVKADDQANAARTMLAQRGGTLVKVPAPDTSRRCSACGLITPGSRETQALFVCKNPDCGWSGNADHNAGRNILHQYRIGLVAIPAAGRAVARRAKRVKPATAR